MKVRNVPGSVGVVCAAALAVGACSAESTHEPTASAVAHWRLVPEVRFGSLDDAAPDAFGEYIALEAAPDGTLYVADQQHAEIRVFGPSGDFQGSVGRRGRGPGEFEDLIALARGPDGRLWAVDYGTRRLSAFDADLRFLETRPLLGNFRGGPGTFRIDSEGRIHSLSARLTATGPDFFYLRDAGGAEDTLRLSRYDGTSREITLPDGRMVSRLVPHTPRFHFAVDSEGVLWSGISESYRLVRVAYGGDTVAVIDRAAQNVALTPEERTLAVAAMREGLAPDAFVDPAWMPEHRPAFERIAADDAGLVWVAVPEPGGKQRFDVFGGSGAPVARADLPAGARVSNVAGILIRGRYLYLEERDDFDVPYVVRYRIETAD